MTHNYPDNTHPLPHPQLGDLTLREYEILLLVADGIKRSSPEKREKIITVRFMHDLPLGKMGVYMGSY